MQRHLWQDPETGELFVSQKSSSGETMWSLTEKRQHFCELRVEGRAGPTLAKHSFAGYHLAWPRQGMRIMWSALDLYSHMNCTSFKGTPSKWFYNMVLGIQSYMGFSDDHILKSGNAADSTKSLSIADHAFLPKGSISSTALIALLCRWSFAPNKRQGALSSDSRSAAICLLQCFVNGLRGEGPPWHVQVRLVPAWSPPWPFTNSSGQMVRLNISPDLGVDISSLRTVAQAPGALSFVRVWWECVLPGVEGDRISVVALLEHISMHPRCAPFFAQVVWQLAKTLEDRLEQALRTGGTAGSSLTLRVSDIADVIDDPRRLCNELFKHVFAGQCHFQRFNSLSITVDKAQVGGLGLFAGGILAPDGHAALSVVQAFLSLMRDFHPQPVGAGRHRRTDFPELVYTDFWCIRLSLVFFVYTNPASGKMPQFALCFRIHQPVWATIGV